MFAPRWRSPRDTELHKSRHALASSGQDPFPHQGLSAYAQGHSKGLAWTAMGRDGRALHGPRCPFLTGFIASAGLARCRRSLRAWDGDPQRERELGIRHALREELRRTPLSLCRHFSDTHGSHSVQTPPPALALSPKLPSFLRLGKPTILDPWVNPRDDIPAPTPPCAPAFPRQTKRLPEARQDNPVSPAPQLGLASHEGGAG